MRCVESPAAAITQQATQTHTEEEDATAAERAAILAGLRLAGQNPRAYLQTQRPPLAFFVQERLKQGNKRGTGFPPGVRLARLVAAGACVLSSVRVFDRAAGLRKEGRVPGSGSLFVHPLVPCSSILRGLIFVD